MVSSASVPGFSHVELDDAGVAHISGTTMKVVELVMAKMAHGWSPEELHFQFPHLSLAQIHSALAYYWDHKDELDADIDRRGRLAAEARDRADTSPLANKVAEHRDG